MELQPLHLTQFCRTYYRGRFSYHQTDTLVLPIYLEIFHLIYRRAVTISSMLGHGNMTIQSFNKSGLKGVKISVILKPLLPVLLSRPANKLSREYTALPDPTQPI